MVVWGGHVQGKVSVLEDKCAHRLVPLSEGHVDPKTGCLECPLHGYQFDTSGCNTLIPTEVSVAAVNIIFMKSPNVTYYDTIDKMCATLNPTISTWHHQR
jgi:phenylpropionate dioxygenase-like ring-hydroxylating dioxygenase large terminal subunit